MSEVNLEPLEGRCTCETITYTLLAPPLVVNCCHCTWCQRETGTAFAVNLPVESYNLKLTSSTSPELVKTPSVSGKGQLIARCPNCKVAVWSHYGTSGKAMSFVRAGTLVDGHREKIRPDAHIFTKSKVPWLDLGTEKAMGVGVFEENYDKNFIWRKDSLERLKVFKKRLEEEMRKKSEGEEQSNN